MQLILWQAEVQRLRHLLFGLAPRAGVGHGERSGDTVGREDQIAVIFAQLLIEAEGIRLALVLIIKHGWGLDMGPAVSFEVTLIRVTAIRANIKIQVFQY